MRGAEWGGGLNVSMGSFRLISHKLFRLVFELILDVWRPCYGRGGKRGNGSSGAGRWLPPGPGGARRGL